MANESVITNITVSNNISNGSGGGIYVSGSKVSITDSTLSGNSDVWGGGFGSYKHNVGGLGYDGRMAGMGGAGDLFFTNHEKTLPASKVTITPMTGAICA